MAVDTVVAGAITPQEVPRVATTLRRVVTIQATTATTPNMIVAESETATAQTERIGLSASIVVQTTDAPLPEMEGAYFLYQSTMQVWKSRYQR